MTVPSHDPRPPRPHLDPTRHLLIYPDYRQRPDGRNEAVPIPLDVAAAEMRAAVEAGRAAESSVGRISDGVVVIAPGRAWVIAALVEELSKRLEPARTVGPIQSDGSLSRLAKELADDLARRALS